MTTKVLPIVLMLAAAGALSACDRGMETEPSDYSRTETTSPDQPKDTGAMSGGVSSAQSTVEDGAITAKIKAALLADDQVKGLQIDVDTSNGAVTLTGEVDSHTQHERAVEIARGTEGVRDVNDQLTVKAGG